MAREIKQVELNNMTKKTRNALAITFSLLFFLTAPIIFFYSQGYRLDWKKKTLTQTGALYFKVSPRKADIFLNRKLRKKTDWLSGSAFIENVLPKKYTVEIKKDGFHPWKKDLEITAQMVTEAKNIVLIPENLNFEILAGNVNNIFFAPDGKKAILRETYLKKGTLLTETKTKEGWVLNILNLRQKIKTSFIEDNKLSPKTVEFVDLKWSPDSKRVLLKTRIAQETKYFILDLQNNKPAILIPLDFIDKNTEDIFFNAQDPQKILLVKAELSSVKQDINQSIPEIEHKTFSIYEALLNEKKILAPLVKNTLAYKINSQNIFWLSSDGFLFKSDLSGKNQERVNFKPFPLQKETEYQIEEIYPKIFLKEDKKLFVFNEETEEFKQILEPVKNLNLCSDLKKIAAWNNSEIWVLFLEVQDYQPQKEMGEVMFLFRFSTRIDKVVWFTGDYLIFNTGDKIKIAEIDDRDQINIVDVGEFENPEIFFNINYKNLYILSKNRLFVSKPIL